MGTAYGKTERTESEVQRREFSEWNQRKKLGEEGLIRRRKAGEQSSKK